MNEKKKDCPFEECEVREFQVFLYFSRGGNLSLQHLSSDLISRAGQVANQLKDLHMVLSRRASENEPEEKKKNLVSLDFFEKDPAVHSFI